MGKFIVSIRLSLNPLKITPPLFFAKLPLNLQTVQAPLFRQFRPIYQFFGPRNLPTATINRIFSAPV